MLPPDNSAEAAPSTGASDEGVALTAPPPGPRGWRERWAARRAARLATPLRDAAVDAALSDRWGSAARAVALAAALGAALVAWLQLSFRARWVTDFIRDNALEMPGRMALIKSLVGGAALGALLVLVVLGVRLWRRLPLPPVERWCWWLSPLAALPLLPVFFRYRIWKDRPEALLPSVLVGALLVELLVSQAGSHVPAVMSRAWSWLGRKIPQRLLRATPLGVAVLAAVGYALFFGFYTLRWHYKLQTHLFDLGINTQLLYASLHGKHMYSTLVFPEAPEKYLANHAKFGQYFLWPFFKLWPRAETLLVAQAAMLGAGALPLYAFARRHVSDWVAMVLALAWVCYYPMQSANFYETNYIMSGSLWVLTAAWAADSKRWGIFVFAYFWALVSREDMPIGLAVMGTFLLLSGHRPKLGLVMALVSTAWFVYLRFVWMEKSGDWWFPDMYKGLFAPGEKGFGSVIKTLVSNPLFVLSKIVEKDKLLYLMHLLLPVAFLPVRRWWAWAALIPGSILTLLATNGKPLTMHTFQYVMHWAPYLFLVTPLVLAAIRRASGHAKQRGALVALGFASAVMTYNLGAFSRRPDTFRGGYFLIRFDYTEQDAERYRDLQEIIQTIPPDASLAATENIGAHVSARMNIYTMRHGPRAAEWILASSKELGLERTKPKLKELLVNGSFGVVRRVGELAVLRKGHDTSGNAQLMTDWKL